jgi:hypothetical protein
MHFVFSALLLCLFVVLLLAGLASVLRDLISRDLRGLDLDLPRDLDHPLRR